MDAARPSGRGPAGGIPQAPARRVRGAPCARRAGCSACPAHPRQRLAERARNTDAHIQYNRLWQRAIANDRPCYDRQTVLEHAAVERATIRDALASADEAAFRKAVARVAGIDSSRARDQLERELRDR